MTIFHPRVGFEIFTMNAGGTNDPADATVVTVNVGKTLITALPTVGWVNSSGLQPGGIKINDTDPGNWIGIRAQSGADEVRVYLPNGSNFQIEGHASSSGDVVNILKTDATTWIVW